MVTPAVCLFTVMEFVARLTMLNRMVAPVRSMAVPVDSIAFT